MTKNLLLVDPDDVPKGRDAFLRENEIVVVRSGAYTADSAIIPKEYEGSVAGYDMVLRVFAAQPEFVALALLSTYLRDHQLILSSLRAAQPHLNAEELGTAAIALPPALEQVVISEAAQRQCGDIENASNHANREIALLHEYRTRLIADVVTGKLDVREAAARLPDEADAGDEIAGDLLEGDEPDDDAELAAEVEEGEG